jgi:hypothetical protein
MRTAEKLVPLVPVAMTFGIQVLLWRELVKQRRLRRRQLPLAKEGNPLIPFAMLFVVWIQSLALNLSLKWDFPRSSAFLTGLGVLLSLALSYWVYRINLRHRT